MKALKAGAAPRTREKGEKCLEGVKATAQSDNTYNITFTGFRGHTYVVSMYDQHKEMVQQWFHTQFQVNQTELQPRNERRVQYTWKGLQIQRPHKWDAAAAPYKDEDVPIDSSRPFPTRARRRHKTKEHRACARAPRT